MFDKMQVILFYDTLNGIVLILTKICFNKMLQYKYMENTKNNQIFYYLGTVLIGLIIGYFVWGSSKPNTHTMQGSHMDMDGAMASMTSSLTGKIGEEFDKAFLAEMIVHHMGAVDMAKMVLTTSKRPELIKLANDIITAQNGEIKMMQDWQKSWFK